MFATTALVCSTVASMVGWFIASRFFRQASWYQSIGVRLYQQKMSQLERPPLSFYQAAVDEGVFSKGLLIIIAGILAKSLVTLVAGLIAVFVLPISIATMPALADQHGDDPALHRWVSQVTILQSTSHLLSAAAGYAATRIWMSTDASPIQIATDSPGATVVLLGGSLLFGLIAAWWETDGHMNKRYL
jgi:hypothetical protein